MGTLIVSTALPIPRFHHHQSCPLLFLPLHPYPHHPYHLRRRHHHLPTLPPQSLLHVVNVPNHRHIHLPRKSLSFSVAILIPFQAPVVRVFVDGHAKKGPSGFHGACVREVYRGCRFRPRLSRRERGWLEKLVRAEKCICGAGTWCSWCTF